MLWVSFNPFPNLLLDWLVKIYEEDWIDGQIKKAQENHLTSWCFEEEERVVEKEGIVDGKMEGAGQQGKEDGGPHHHHYGGCELCWISKHRCGSSHSKEEGAGQKGVFEEVYIVTQDLGSWVKYINCLPKLLILNHHVLEAGDAVGFECPLNPINGFLFKSWELGVMDNLGDCRIKISVEADVDRGLIITMDFGFIFIES